ncbi:DUF6207 family protein [Streptomyces sp. ATMOS53]
MNEVHVSRLAWSTSRPPTRPPRSPSSSCSPTGGRWRAAEHTTRDAGEPGVRLRCYLDLRQLHFLDLLALEPTHPAGQIPEQATRGAPWALLGVLRA